MEELSLDLFINEESLDVNEMFEFDSGDFEVTLECINNVQFNAEHCYSQEPPGGEILMDDEGTEYEEVNMEIDESWYNNRNIRCKVKNCPSILRDIYALINHQDDHGESLFECRFCLKSCKYRCNFKAHISRHFRAKKAKSQKIYECRYCDKNFMSKWYLSQHEKFHENPKAFYCSECDKSYKSAPALNFHLKRKHPVHNQENIEPQK